MWKPQWGNSLACSKLMLVSWSTLMYGYLGKIYPADFDTQTDLPRRCSRYVVKGSKQRPSWRQNLLSSSTFYSWAPANIFRLLCRAMVEIRISNDKVWVFWEGHKIWKNLRRTFDKSVVFCARNNVLVKKSTKIFQNKCGQVVLYKL